MRKFLLLLRSRLCCLKLFYPSNQCSPSRFNRGFQASSPNTLYFWMVMCQLLSQTHNDCSFFIFLFNGGVMRHWNWCFTRELPSEVQAMPPKGHIKHLAKHRHHECFVIFKVWLFLRGSQLRLMFEMCPTHQYLLRWIKKITHRTHYCGSSAYSIVKNVTWKHRGQKMPMRAYSSLSSILEKEQN